MASRRFAIVLSLLSMAAGAWLMDWGGPYGPLEAHGWYRRHFYPDRHAELYIITDRPEWDYGVVRSCQPAQDLGETIRRRHPSLRKEKVLDCSSLLPEGEFLTREAYAVTFKEK